MKLLIKILISSTKDFLKLLHYSKIKLLAQKRVKSAFDKVYDIIIATTLKFPEIAILQLLE
ncbi:MAG: hypothetical protein ACFFAN_10250 [Promethearchaeota archaeon]